MQTINKILSENLDPVIDVIPKLISALINMTTSSDDNIVMKAIDHLKTCMEYLIMNSEMNEQIELDEKFDKSAQQSDYERQKTYIFRQSHLHYKGTSPAKMRKKHQIVLRPSYFCQN